MTEPEARPLSRDLPATTADDARKAVDALDAKVEAEFEKPADADRPADAGKTDAPDLSQETPAPEPPD